MFLGSVSGTRRPEPWLSQPGDGDCFYFSLLSGVCTYIPTNRPARLRSVSPFAVPQHKARPKTTVTTGEMPQFPKRRSCVFQASLNNAFCIAYCSSVVEASKQASSSQSPALFPARPTEPNNDPAQECGDGRRAAAWPRNEDTTTHHTHTHTHTHPPTQHKAPVGRREFSAPFLSSQPIIPLLPVAVFLLFFFCPAHTESLSPFYRVPRRHFPPYPERQRGKQWGESGEGGRGMYGH